MNQKDLSVLLIYVSLFQRKPPAMASLPPSPSLGVGILIICRICQEMPICLFERRLTLSSTSTTSSATGDRHPEQPSEPENEQQLVGMKSCEQRKRQPIIFVRYAAIDSDREAIDISAQELSDDGIGQRRISCTLDEIQYVLSLLQEQEACVDEAYRTQWKEKSAFNGTVFRLSLLRPTLEPLFPHRDAMLKRQRRIDRMLKLQTAEQMRMDELRMRREKNEIIDKVCCKIGCEEWALLQCSRCQNVWYCCEKRELNGVIPLSVVSPCCSTNKCPHYILYYVLTSSCRSTPGLETAA